MLTNLDIFTELVKKDFPQSKIRFHNDLNTSENLVYAKKYDIIFQSKKFMDSLSKKEIISTIAHEYVHFKQKSTDIFHRLKYDWIPWCRLNKELDAYKMNIIVEITLANNNISCPSNHYELYQLTDDSLRRLVDIIFSEVYYYKKLPRKYLMEKYFKKLKFWHNLVLLKYFKERLDFNQKISYIVEDADIYTNVMRFLIRKELQ